MNIWYTDFKRYINEKLESYAHDIDTFFRKIRIIIIQDFTFNWMGQNENLT